MYKSIFVLVIAAILATGCNSPSSSNSAKTSATAQQVSSAIVGLASPIVLEPEQTTIFWEDYFSDFDKIQLVELPQGLQEERDKTSRTSKISGKLPGMFGVVNITYDSTRYDILLKKAQKSKHTFTYKSSGKPQKVQIKGTFNGWNPEAGILKLEEGVWAKDFILKNGLHQYKMVVDGVEVDDKNNPDFVDNGMGGRNNTFRTGAEPKATPFVRFKGVSKGALQFEAAQPKTNIIVFFENKLISVLKKGATLFEVPIPNAEDYPAIKNPRSHIRVFSIAEGQFGNDLLVPLNPKGLVLSTDQLTRQDQQAKSMYFLMVDRFFDGDKKNNLPVDNDSIHPRANYQGGDLAGVNAKINDGYFDDLGINTLWVSPIAQNPLGAYGLWDKGTTSTFSGYHGYWPISSTQIDTRFGSNTVLKKVISSAHEKEINVLVDYVANHVHQEHPVFEQHPDWATDLYLPDGSLNTERWDDHRLTTWFDTFLPTLDFSKPEVVEAMTDSALYWFQEFELDGFRHDATKHIPEEFWRVLTKKIKDNVIRKEGRSIYQIGETYGSPELISSYINSGMLDAQFDFNLYDAAVATFSQRAASFDNLSRVLKESLANYGSHHLMGNITGNQDRVRFTSYADGSLQLSDDGKLVGWTQEIENRGEVGFKRMRNLMGFMFSIPGVPTIYYGDEIGMPGAGDPDNRRMMTFEGLDKDQKETKEFAKRIINLRNENMALMYGDFYELYRDKNTWVFARVYGDNHVIVSLNSGGPVEVSFEVPTWLNLENKKSQFNKSVQIKQGNTVIMNIVDESFDIIL